MQNETYKITPYNGEVELDMNSYKSGKYVYFSYELILKSLNLKAKIKLIHTTFKYYDKLELMLLNRRFSKSTRIDMIELHTGHNYYDLIGFLLDGKYFYPLTKDGRNESRHNYFKDISEGEWNTPLDTNEEKELIQEFDEYFNQNKILNGQLRFYIPVLFLSSFSIFKFIQDGNILGTINTILVTAIIFLALKYFAVSNKNEVMTYCENMDNKKLNEFKIQYMCNAKPGYDNPKTYANKTFIESANYPYLAKKNELFYSKTLKKTFV